MAELQEVFEDFAENTKKAVKSKPFLVAAGVVGLVALYVGWKRTREADDSAPYEAIGYAGYPTVGGGGGEFSDGVEDNSAYYESIINEYQSSITDLQNQYGTTMDELQTNILDLTEAHKTTQEALAERDAQLQMERDLSQMKANSELYNAISDTEEKKRLHEENLAIAEKYGYTYDSRSGNYFNSGGSVVYTTTQQQALQRGSSGAVTTQKKSASSAVTYKNNVDYQSEINKAILSGASASTIDSLNAQRNAKISASGSTTSKANTSYDKNTDYQALINKAKASGASQSVINNLTEQRNAKIKGEGLNSDGTKKT